MVTFWRYMLLPLDNCLYALQPAIPNLTRSNLHRCLQRHGISRLPVIKGGKPQKKKFKTYPIGDCHINIAEVQTESADRRGQAVSVRRHRPHIEVRPCRVA